MSASECQCSPSGGKKCEGSDCKCCPWCCEKCKDESKCETCKGRKGVKGPGKVDICGPSNMHKPCTDPSKCNCKCCLEKKNPQAATIFWCIIGAIIFAILLAFAFILYKTKSKAYLIPKVVYEWTGYTTTYSGLGSKNLQ